MDILGLNAVAFASYIICKFVRLPSEACMFGVIVGSGTYILKVAG